jgi:tetratricopeptide (TPR) repeat protein
VYDELHDYVRAAEYHQQDLAIARQTGEKRAEEAALVNLANAQSELGQYAAAVERYEQALAIAQHIGDPWGEGLIAD